MAEARSPEAPSSATASTVGFVTADAIRSGLGPDAKYAANAGFETTVIWDATRPVDASDSSQVRGELAAAGVAVIRT